MFGLQWSPWLDETICLHNVIDFFVVLTHSSAWQKKKKRYKKRPVMQKKPPKTNTYKTFTELNETASELWEACCSQPKDCCCNNCGLNQSLEGSEEQADSSPGARRCSGGRVQAAPAGWGGGRWGPSSPAGAGEAAWCLLLSPERRDEEREGVQMVSLDMPLYLFAWGKNFHLQHPHLHSA